MKTLGWLALLIVMVGALALCTGCSMKFTGSLDVMERWNRPTAATERATINTTVNTMTTETKEVAR